MRLRDRNDYYDPTALAAGRSDFEERLAKFLDNRIEGDGDGWAPVPDEEENELYELIKRLIALKWGTDADGDLPINFSICNRNKGHLNDFIIPYSIDASELREKGLSEDEIQEKEELYWMDLARAAAHMTSSAQELMRKFDYHFADKLVKRREARDRQQMLADALTQINGREDESHYDEDRDLIYFLTKPKEYGENDKRAGVFQSYPEMHEALQAAMVAKYPERLAKAITDIAELMESYEDDDGTEFYNLVTKPRLEFIRVFGNAFNKHSDIGPKANELFQKGKLKRAAARVAASKAV